MAGDTTAYRIDGLAVPAVLEHIHDLLETVTRDHPEVAADDLFLFETAVIEIAGNVVEHGRPPGQVQYSFSLDVGPERLDGLLAHSGEEVQDPLGRAMPDDAAESGRGLPLAELALDDLDYSFEGGRSRWRMTRHRRALDTS